MKNVCACAVLWKLKSWHVRHEAAGAGVVPVQIEVYQTHPNWSRCSSVLIPLIECSNSRNCTGSSRDESPFHVGCRDIPDIAEVPYENTRLKGAYLSASINSLAVWVRKVYPQIRVNSLEYKICMIKTLMCSHIILSRAIKYTTVKKGCMDERKNSFL